MNSQKNKRKPATPRRYAVRFEGPAEVEQLGELTTNLEIAVTRAIRHHERTGYKIWVFALKDGQTVYRLERAALGAVAQ